MKRITVKPKLKLILILFLFFYFLNKSAAQYQLTFFCKGFPNQQVHLKLIHGGTLKQVDSAYLKNEMLQFNLKHTNPIGLYLMKLNDSLYFDFLFHHQNIKIQLNGSVLPVNVEVLASDENKVYFEYLKYDYLYSVKSDSLFALGDKLYMANRIANTEKLDSIKQQLHALEKSKREFVENLAKKHPDKSIIKIIKAIQLPDYKQYVELNPGKYISEQDFYKDHFFDNINFSDTVLINTSILFDITYAYLKDILDTHTVNQYCDAVDFILQKAGDNVVKQYLVNLLISSFRSNKGLEDVAGYIINKYLLPPQIKDDSLRNKILKETVLKNELLPNDTAPNIILPTTNGSLLHLHNIKAKAILVVFWTPDCDHCVASIPDLKKIYKKYHQKGLEIFMVSLDLDYKFWMHAIQDLEITKWIHVSDNKGLENPFIYIYHLKQTPTYFVLNENKIIFSIPQKIREINKDLQTLLGK